ncbi:MAG: MerR family transcriptional regulator [Candidatus Omnitrophota bacterium]
MVFRNKKGEVIKAFPYGSEERQRFEQGIDLLFKLYQLDRERQLNAKFEKEKKLNSRIDVADKKIFRKRIKRCDRIYNMTQAAAILRVHRQTLYYWIRKGWIKPKRDRRNYPVYTVLDIEHIIKWKNSIKY